MQEICSEIRLSAVLGFRKFIGCGGGLGFRALGFRDVLSDVLSGFGKFGV